MLVFCMQARYISTWKCEASNKDSVLPSLFGLYGQLTDNKLLLFGLFFGLFSLGMFLLFHDSGT